MKRRHNTLSYEEGSGHEAGLGQNDRSKLSQGPLGRFLTGVTHLVYGVENELKDFDEKLEKELRKVDQDYRYSLDRYYRLKQMAAENLWDENHPSVATLKLVEGQLRQLREDLRPKVSDILFDAYRRALAFVVYYLDDQRLAELRWPTNQKMIAQAIYENLDYYESYYVLGKGVRTMLAEQIEKMGAERGGEVIKNVLPGKIEENAQDEDGSDTDRVSEPTLPGMGVRPLEPYIYSPRQGIKRVAQTMRPQFIPQSEAEIRAGAPQDIAMPKENPPRSKTIPYAGQLPPSPSGPEVYGRPRPAEPTSPQLGYVPSKEEIKQTEENAARMAKEVTEVSRLSKLPDLTGLFSPDEFVENSPAFSDITEEVRDNVQAECRPTAETVPDIKPAPAPISTPSANSSFQLPSLVDNDDLDEEDTGEVRMPITHLPGMNLPPAAPTPVGSFSSTENGSQQYASAPRKLQPSVTGETLSNLEKVIVNDNQPEQTAVSETVNNTSRPSSRPTSPEVPVAKMENEVREPLQELAANTDESEDTVKRKIKRSWGDSIRNAASSAWGWTKRHYKGAVLAAGIALGLSADHTASKYLTDTTDKQPVPVDTSKVTPPPAPIVVAPPVEEQKKDDAEKVKSPAPTPEVAKTRTFGRILTNSKSPIVQDIITKGETKLGMSTITDTMIDSFAGLASAEQLHQLHELQKYINLGLGVYFNEHFGTPAKVAASLKDPKLRNLYRTAKVAQEKGWFQSYHTKERYPKSYALAVQMLADSSELGLDESANPNTKVQDYVRGNMFQAKLPGNTIKLRKANGQYHVVQDMVFDILEGKTVSDMLDTRFASATARAKGAVPGVDFSKDAQPKAPATPQKIENNAPKAPPAVQPDLNKPGQTGQILPNIQQKGSLGYNQDQLLDEVDRGWDEIIRDGDKLVATENKLAVNKQDVQKAAVTLSKFEQEMKEVDDGWEEIGKNLDKLKAEKAGFEKTARVEFDLPLYFTTRQENEAVIPNVADKMAALYPEADGTLVRKMIKQYGWIGMKLISRERGHFVVELNNNFHKNILRPILQKKISGSRLA